MKTETQPKHTQGELNILAGGSERISIATKGKKGKTIFITLGKTGKDMVNCKRMIKTWSMHEELVQAIKTQSEIISKILASERIVNLDESIAYYEQIVKKAEQK